jgi:hypothetical protein
MLEAGEIGPNRKSPAGRESRPAGPDEPEEESRGGVLKSAE